MASKIEIDFARKREVLEKARRLGEIVGRAQRENRDLSRREAAEVREITRDAERLRAELQPFDPRRTQFTPGLAEESGRPELLAPSDSVAEYLRDSGQATQRGFDEPERLRFGAMVRGAVTGVWKGAEAEQRALSESALAGGGYLIGPALSARVIDRVRANMAVMKAGAITVPLST